MAGKVHPPSYIHLYYRGTAETLDIAEIGRYLHQWLGRTEVDIRTDFVSYVLSKIPRSEVEFTIDILAERLARAKVRDPNSPKTAFEPLYGEIEYEKRRLKATGRGGFGVLYDGFELQRIFHELLPEMESNMHHLHIIFTDQFLGTWDWDDRRYHVRVNVCGYPAIISTTGVVEAPAKPKEYYLLKRRYQMMGASDSDLIKLKEKFKGQFIDYDDPRLTEVMKGYAMQALLFHLIEDPFCDDRDCRLYNAHWQEEMIRAQLGGKDEFCAKHRRILESQNSNQKSL